MAAACGLRGHLIKCALGIFFLLLMVPQGSWVLASLRKLLSWSLLPLRGLFCAHLGLGFLRPVAVLSASSAPLGLLLPLGSWVLASRRCAHGIFCPSGVFWPPGSFMLGKSLVVLASITLAV
eukprot:5831088-Amphidinium_carterae.2